MNGILDMLIFNVQSANAIWVSTPNNRNIMYDIGVGHTSTGQKFSPLKYLYQKGVRHLDALVLTHPHGDHVDGIDDLRLFSIGMLTCARQISREEILAGNSDSANEWVDAYLSLDRNYSTPVIDAESVYNPQNNGGVRILTFGQQETAVSNLNNRSIVSVLEYLGMKVLIPGDAEPAAFRQLLQDSNFVRALNDIDVMIVPHHGRESGYCSEIFDYFSPRVCIVSDGEAQETDAASLYSQKATGVKVVNKSTGMLEKDRKCLTTRNDGAMLISFYTNEANPNGAFRIETHV